MAMASRTRLKPPATFTAVNSGNNIQLNWAAVSSAFNISAYVLEHSTDGLTYTPLYSGAALSYLSTGLALGTSYQYRLRVLDAQGHYSAYVRASASTPNAPARRAPSAGLHSIAIRPGQQPSGGGLPTLPVLPAGCTMAVVRYNLGDIDNGDGTYTYTRLDKELSQCAALNIYLVAMIITRTFDGDPNATPPKAPTNPLPANIQSKSEIFTTSASGSPSSGVQGWRWCPAVQDSFQKTCAKIGARYGVDNTGKNAFFLGIATQETSTGGAAGGTSSVYTAGNFTGSDKYDAAVFCQAQKNESDSITQASPYFRHKGYLNFLSGVNNATATTMLTDVALHIVANGGSVGCPDLVSARAGGGIPSRVYPILAAAHAAGGWTFGSLQSGEWNGTGAGDPAPVSPKDLYNYATASHTYTDGGALDHRNVGGVADPSTLNLDEICWDNETGAAPNFSNDAIPIITSHPHIGTWTP